MIESSPVHKKHDRLVTFLRAYGLKAELCGDDRAANLLIVDAGGCGGPTHLIYCPQSMAAPSGEPIILAAAAIDFNNSLNPLVGALPRQLLFDLTCEPQLQGLADLIVSESCDPRCGGGTIHARLCEVLVVLAIRKALAAGTVNAGMLAGLAHHELHPSLVAMHEEPAKRWSTIDLAEIAGMKRGRFINVFNKTVGQTPGNYLTDWRLSLARVQLRSGQSVKAVAAAVGFGSAEAFSRAFTRKFGYPPSDEKAQ